MRSRFGDARDLKRRLRNAAILLDGNAARQRGQKESDTPDDYNRFSLRDRESLKTVLRGPLDEGGSRPRLVV